LLLLPRHSSSTLFPYTTLFRSDPIVLGSIENQETILLAGPLFDRTRDLGATSYRPLVTPFTAKPVELSTDDWPFLFLKGRGIPLDRKSTRLNSSHDQISYAVFC